MVDLSFPGLVIGSRHLHIVVGVEVGDKSQVLVRVGLHG